MKVTVDATKCQGHNRCMIYAPDIFDTDDFGFAFVQRPDEDVPADAEERVRSAAANCPELAILLIED